MKIIQEKKESIEKTHSEELKLKKLLYEKGKPLENVIIHVLNLIGFKASHYQENDSEFDAVFESIEGRMIGEVEGRDNKAINISKLRQLEMNISEDFEREEITKMAKGVLFGNAFRLKHPKERGEFFTKKCLIASQRNGTALVKTTDLFKIAQYLSEKKDNKFAKKCRKMIFDSVGIVEFPEIEKKERKKIEEIKNWL